MRLFISISKANELHRLSSILNTSKKNNKVNGITGILSYKRGYYLQALEGSDQKVSALIDKLRTDTRHTNMLTILDIETERRYFSAWSMNLAPLLSRNQEYRALVRDIAPKLRALPVGLRRLMLMFFQFSGDRGSRAIQPPQLVKGQRKAPDVAYEVTRWPNFIEIELSPHLLSLCASLLRNPVNYTELLEREIYPDQAELNAALKRLRQLGCLAVRPAVSKAMDTEVDKPDHSSLVHSATFVDRMRDFIHARIG